MLLGLKKSCNTKTGLILYERALKMLENDMYITVKPGFHKANYNHNNDQFRVKRKRFGRRMTAQPYNRFVYVSWSWHLPCDGNQA